MSCDQSARDWCGNNGVGAGFDDGPLAMEYYRCAKPKAICENAAIVGATALIFTVVLALCAWQLTAVSYIVSLAVGWVIVPPIFFFYEYHFLFRNREYGVARNLEKFKYGQQVSIAIWAGIAVSLVALSNADHFKQKAPESNLTVVNQSVCVSA